MKCFTPSTARGRTARLAGVRERAVVTVKRDRVRAGACHVGGARLNPARPGIDGHWRGLTLPGEISRLTGARDFRLRHRGAGAEGQSSHGGEEKGFGDVHGQHSFVWGPPELFGWCRCLEDQSVVPVIDKQTIRRRAARNYPERWQLAFLIGDKMSPSMPPAFRFGVTWGEA